MSSVTHLQYGVVAGSGVVLSLPHSTGLQSSLPLLQKNYKFSRVFFWGKLIGLAGEYLIAMGIEESYATKKFFYWCVWRTHRGTPAAPAAISGRSGASAGGA